jgi:hypothetical protein
MECGWLLVDLTFPPHSNLLHSHHSSIPLALAALLVIAFRCRAPAELRLVASGQQPRGFTQWTVCRRTKKQEICGHLAEGVFVQLS